MVKWKTVAYNNRLTLYLEDKQYKMRVDGPPWYTGIIPMKNIRESSKSA